MEDSSVSMKELNAAPAKLAFPVPSSNCFFTSFNGHPVISLKSNSGSGSYILKSSPDGFPFFYELPSLLTI
jgi:hypothetical protein